MYVLLLLAIVLIVNMAGSRPQDQVQDLSYSSLLELIREDGITHARIQGVELVGRQAGSQIPESEFGSRYDITCTLPSLERFYQDVNAIYAQRLGIDASLVTSADYAFVLTVKQAVGGLLRPVVFPAAPASRCGQGRGDELWPQPGPAHRPGGQQGHL